MDLKELLGEDLYSQVTEKLGDKKIIIDDGSFISKSKFDQVNTDKKKAERERDTYRTQAERYKGGMTKDEVITFEANLEKKYKIKDEQFNTISEKYSNILNGTAPSNTGGVGNFRRSNNNTTSEDSKDLFTEIVKNNSLRK